MLTDYLKKLIDKQAEKDSGDDRDRPEELLYSAEPWSLQSTERISRGNQISTSEEYV